MDPSQTYGAILAFRNIQRILNSISNTVFDNKKEVAEKFIKIPLFRDIATRKTEICVRSVHENIGQSN